MVQVVSIAFTKRRVVELAQRLPLLPQEVGRPLGQNTSLALKIVFWKGKPEALCQCRLRVGFLWPV